MAELAPAETPGLFTLGFAGDTYNTTWYLHVLRPDIPTRYFTCVGTDALSAQLLDAISDAGIDTSAIAQIPDRTVGLYLISLQAGERSFSYWRETSAARQLARDAAALKRAVDAADLVYFSGITLAILDATDRTTLLGELGAARAAGKTVAFDPNLRPRLWGSPAEMCEWIMQAAQVSDIVLPSYDDEKAYFEDVDINATCTRYVEAGARTVVVKDGPGPIHFWHSGTSGQAVPPASGLVVDTTAAGDSFNAGFLAGLDSGRAIDQVILSAARIAGEVIGRKGALVTLDPAAIADWRAANLEARNEVRNG